jgi:hypothetical protein
VEVSQTVTAEIPPRRVVQAPIVIAPDIILDLVRHNGRHSQDAQRLFNAIVENIDLKNDDCPAMVASVTIPIIYHACGGSYDPHIAKSVTSDVLRILEVVELRNHDYHEALFLRDFALEDALQFVTCRVVGAKYLVTRKDYGVKRAPVHRRTAAEVLPFVKARPRQPAAPTERA